MVEQYKQAAEAFNAAYKKTVENMEGVPADNLAAMQGFAKQILRLDAAEESLRERIALMEESNGR